MEKYTVVQFENDGGYEVVLYNWINENEKK
jgi:hypothetical protein